MYYVVLAAAYGSVLATARWRWRAVEVHRPLSRGERRGAGRERVGHTASGHRTAVTERVVSRNHQQCRRRSPRSCPASALSDLSFFNQGRVEVAGPGPWCGGNGVPPETPAVRPVVGNREREREGETGLLGIVGGTVWEVE